MVASLGVTMKLMELPIREHDTTTPNHNAIKPSGAHLRERERERNGREKAASINTSPFLHLAGVPVSVWTGVATCVFSMVSCMIASSLDYYGRKRIKKDASEELPNLKGVLKFKPSVWVSVRE